MRGKILLLLALVALSGCAPTTKWAGVDSGLVGLEREKQMDMAVAMLFAEQSRLSDVASTIMYGATDLCGEKVKPTVGVFWVGQDDLKGPMKEATIRLYNIIDNNPVVLLVNKGGPAYNAGIRIKDRVIAVNGVPISSVKQLQDIWEPAIKDRARWPINVTVQRGDQSLELPITPRAACDYPVDLADQDVVNAYADGKKIYVTRGMMHFIHEDRELALVVAHELAHNTMGHISKKSGNMLLGAIVDGFAAAYGVNTQGAFGKAAGNAYSQDFEMEADYVGLYAMARSGQDITDAANFWRRMGAANPGSIQQKKGYFNSHPSSPERFVAIDKAVSEIKAKQAAGKPIAPEMKEQQASLAEKPMQE